METDDAMSELTLTTEVVVTCSFCGEATKVPFRHGAVMPNPTSEQGVRCFVPRLDGGRHECKSKRHIAARQRFMARPPMSA